MLSQTTIDPPPPQKRMVNPNNIYIDMKVQTARTHEPHQQIVTPTAPQTNICQIPVKSPVLISSHTVSDNETFKQSCV